MEESKPINSINSSSSSGLRGVEAAAFLEARDAIGPDESTKSSNLLFGRDSSVKKASADAVMDRVRALARHDGEAFGAERVFQRGTGASRSYVLRIVLLAAVLAALVSSILTYGVMRSDSTVEVRFVLAAPEARSVTLAADFNGWSPGGYELTRGVDGTWEITVPLRKGRSYAYNFIIDGERWIPDPASSIRLDDGFGGASSSLVL
ncbi:MAG: isoamylase early set domain-containing protein [Spirochaetia bacterium]|jgi:hypothetical protein|nr:isoamylase early set domain-containing protein [Spirochaetia bacterium]